MNATLLLDFYERIADAPDAVAQLRRFVLDLAVRGKLVEQVPTDEAASELLKRIEAEKARSKKKDKPFPVIQPDEAPYLIPSNWEWVRMRQVTSDRGQKVPDQDFSYIDVTAINKEAGYIAETKVLSALEAPSRARKIVSKGDVLYSCVRPYLLNIAVIEDDITPAPIASTAFAVLNGFKLVMPRYLWIVLRSPFMIERVEERMRGQAYPAINDSDFALLPLPLPPLAEQRRIVARVDELMALCDKLEQARAERETRRDTLAAAVLARLGQPDEDAAFREDAVFALEHVAALTTRPEEIKALRQAILNLAVRGKLVPQDPADEPASELLKRIQHSFGEQNKTLSSKEITTHSPDEQHSIPNTWIWTKLDTISSIGTGSTPLSSEASFYKDGTIPWVGSSATSQDYIEQAETHITEKAKQTYRLKIYPIGTLLVALYGQGKTRGQIAELRIPATVNQACAAIVFPELFDELRLYVRRVFEKKYDELRGLAAGGTQPNLNVGKIKNTFIPLPPLAEQKRIVAKVDELMALCDELEASLVVGDGARRRLLDAVLHGALADVGVVVE